MREDVGVLLVEDDKGEISVQLFANSKILESWFENLNGRVSEPKKRATLLSLRYENDKVVDVKSKSKIFPYIESVEDRPDGYVLGEGPVFFNKQKEGRLE